MKKIILSMCMGMFLTSCTYDQVSGVFNQADKLRPVLVQACEGVILLADLAIQFKFNDPQAISLVSFSKSACGTVDAINKLIVDPDTILWVNKLGKDLKRVLGGIRI